MQLNSYLIFNGQCEDAFHSYEQTLGGKIEAMIPHAGAPAESHVPAEWASKIMPARGSDARPGRYEATKGCWVNIGVHHPAEAERILQALAENGSVCMPLVENLLGYPIRYAGQSVWNTLDAELRVKSYLWRSKA
ncbi:MAG TPA: hypothetical protein VME43_27095 [Bryobacteraceae bacterium]|nr:hypothetical protein [Bryobacteraceae bacterium]